MRTRERGTEFRYQFLGSIGVVAKPFAQLAITAR
jgi:hypothetical protein